MEKALYITDVGQLRYYDSTVSRIYFGQEFCERLMPTLDHVRSVLDFTAREGLEFTFVTPYLTDKGLNNVEYLLREIAEQRPGIEVVFNDWGLFFKLATEYSMFKPVMGRLLNKMKRDSRLLRFMDLVPLQTNAYFRRCDLDVSIFRDFLMVEGIFRVELDNMLQGVDLNLRDTGLCGSLYVPYVYVSTSRLCLAISCDVPGQENRVEIVPCRRECKKYIFNLEHPAMPVPLIRKGNSIFLKNETMPDDCYEDKGIDRVVWEPEIPL
jgi:hypothetical protein